MADAKQRNEKATEKNAETQVREPVHHESIAETGTMTMETETGALAPVQQGSVMLAGDDASMMFAADANKGMEGATAESFAIPFLIVLQKGSPQVDEASGVALPGARQGMLFNTVTGQLYDVRPADKDRPNVTPLIAIPCAYRRVWIRWGARKAGGGFKGELTDAQVAEMRRLGTLKEVDGKLLVPDANGAIHDKCDQVNDHRNHYVLTLDEDGAWQQALISLTSTQIKKSKNLMAAIASVKMKNPTNGMIFQPPAYANLVGITTQPESNDKGNWMGIAFALAGKVQRRDLYEAAKQFNEAIKTGAVSENYNNLAENAPVDAGEGGGMGEPSAARPDKF